MDLRLPKLADANLHLNVAEEAITERAFTTARDELDKAGAALAELRGLWPEMDGNERGLMSALATPLSNRYKAAAAKLPALSVLSEGAPVEDPEQDEAPPEE